MPISPDPPSARKSISLPGVVTSEIIQSSHCHGRAVLIRAPVGDRYIRKTSPAWRIWVVPSARRRRRSEEHTSELQSLMRISYAVFCLKKNTKKNKNHTRNSTNND